MGKMKPFAVILALFALAQCLAFSEEDAFYVWQQSWSSNVLQAISQEAPCSLYPLVTVVPKEGKSTLTRIPWKNLSVQGHRIIPVVRIPLGTFQRTDLAEELTALTQRLEHQRAPLPLEEIQFDLDCPERLLGRYLHLIQTYRQRHPGVHISITALPVHLRHRTFRELADAVDYYVLQVHGLEVPSKLGDPTQLLNMKIAKKALRQAEAIGRPYRVALPCYAYELNFSSTSGAFLFLTAEKPSRRTDTVKQRCVANPSDLVALHQKIVDLKQARGVIWFRLPVPGDRLCLPRPTLAALQSGLLPKVNVQCRVLPISPTTFELELYNANTIHSARVSLHLLWNNPAGSYDLFQKIDAAHPVPGQLPTTLSVPMPPPGESTKIGWFQSTQPPKSEILLK